MTESAAVEPLTDKERAEILEFLYITSDDERMPGSELARKFLSKYESRLVQAEDRLRELENALGKVHTMAVLKRDEAPPAWRKDRLKTIANFVRQALKGDGK